MKAKHPIFIRKAAVKNMLNALLIATTSTLLMLILMTLTAKMVYSYPSRFQDPVDPIFENENCTTTLSDDQFKLKKDLIAQKYFEETIVKLSKELMEQYCLTSNQVKELMMLFSFDRTRMDFASFAIEKVLDPGNFGVCKAAFVISSNHIVIDDLVKQYQTSRN